MTFSGGPGAAHEAEQFCWNDHVVIPVQCTGGAASGKFNVPSKIFDVSFAFIAWQCIFFVLISLSLVFSRVQMCNVLFFPEKGVWHFIQIEMSGTVFKKKKYFKKLPANC